MYLFRHLELTPDSLGDGGGASGVSSRLEPSDRRGAVDHPAGLGTWLGLASSRRMARKVRGDGLSHEVSVRCQKWALIKQSPWNVTSSRTASVKHLSTLQEPPTFLTNSFLDNSEMSVSLRAFTRKLLSAVYSARICSLHVLRVELMKHQFLWGNIQRGHWCLYKHSECCVN